MRDRCSFLAFSNQEICDKILLLAVDSQTLEKLGQEENDCFRRRLVQNTDAKLALENINFFIQAKGFNYLIDAVRAPNGTYKLVPLGVLQVQSQRM